MTQLQACIDGMAVWTPFWPNWEVARQALARPSSEHQEDQPLPNAPIPLPAMLPPAERRRAPQTVSLALEVAHNAINMWGGNPAELLSVFTSGSGDTLIIDDMCSTLSNNPELISPTRFIHSIHNAPAGVWSMSTANEQANTALSAHRCSFANGLLEAVVQCHTEQKPILFVGYDTKAPNALDEALENPLPMALALIISAQPSSATQCVFSCRLVSNQDAQSSPQTAWAPAQMTSGLAQAWPLLGAIALAKNAPLNLTLSAHQALAIQLAFPIRTTTDSNQVMPHERS